MDEFPPVTDLAANPDDSGAGHLWILELVEGVPLRFSLHADGQLAFADRERRLDPERVPPAVRPAVEAVRAQFRRDAFRGAVEDVSTVTFYGIATCQHRLAYDWDALPAFVGYDVAVPARGGLLPPDATHASFDRLGLTPAPAIEREVRADAFVPDRFSFPESAWAESPVAGVRLADKHGWRGRLDNPDRPPEPEAAFDDAETAVETLLDDDRLDSLTTAEPVDQLQAELAREHRATLAAAGVDPASAEFQRAIGKALGRR